MCTTAHVVKDFNKIDFDGIRAHLARKSELRKSMSKEDKDRAFIEEERRAPYLALSLSSVTLTFPQTTTSPFRAPPSFRRKS